MTLQPGPADLTPLLPFRGSVDRPKPVLELGPAGPWQAKVTVTRLQLAGIGARYEIAATRTGGPKLPGTPDLKPGQTLGHVTDRILEQDGELAQAVARRAFEQLTNTHAPDLRAIAGALRGTRRPGDH